MIRVVRVLESSRHVLIKGCDVLPVEVIEAVDLLGAQDARVHTYFRQDIIRGWLRDVNRGEGEVIDSSLFRLGDELLLHWDDPEVGVLPMHQWFISGVDIEGRAKSNITDLRRPKRKVCRRFEW